MLANWTRFLAILLAFLAAAYSGLCLWETLDLDEAPEEAVGG